MKLLQEGKHILWMVWAVVAVGVMGGIFTIVLIGWNMSAIQTQRVQLAKHEQELLQISETVRKHAVAGEAELRNLVEGTFRENLIPESVHAIKNLIKEYRESDTSPNNSLRSPCRFGDLWRRHRPDVGKSVYMEKAISECGGRCS